MSKIALCIGINDYPGTNSDLAGCVNDAQDWAAALKDRGFDVTTMINRDATKNNMTEGMRTAIRRAKSGDSVVITYSGHGTWVPDESGDEGDGRDEALCPADLAEDRVLLDDELHQLFSEAERGAKVVLLSDSCHSGSVSRLAPAGPRAPGEARVRFIGPETFLKGKRLEAARVLGTRWFPVFTKRFPALLISGCRDQEYSYDAWFGGRGNGAFTHHAIKTLKTLPETATYRDWHRKIRDALPSSQYPQSPNLLAGQWQKAWRALA